MSRNITDIYFYFHIRSIIINHLCMFHSLTCSCPGKPEATSGSSVGVTVGVVVAVVVVVAAGVIVGFFIWRRRKQRENW